MNTALDVVADLCDFALRNAPEARGGTLDASLWSSGCAAHAALEAVVEAAKPFDALLQRHNEKQADNVPVFGINGAMITIADLKALRAALEAVNK